MNARDTWTPAPVLAGACALVLVAGLVAGGLGALTALLVVSAAAWLWPSIPRLVAVVLTVATAVLLVAVLFGASFGSIGSTSSSGVTHHGRSNAPPPPP